jgi:sugar-specific transcriptional regulator TrmB
MSQALTTLTKLGFTPLEAVVYEFLLRESPATAYRVAQALGKPPASIYQVIESLGKKRAIITEPGKTRMHRAVPIKQLMTMIETEFQSNRQLAEGLLDRYEGPSEDGGIYVLTGRDQVFEMCRSLISKAEQQVLGDVFPLPLSMIQADLGEAAKRGVSIDIVTYQSCVIDGVRLVVNPDGQSILDRWPGVWINLVSDAREHILALLSPDCESSYKSIYSSNMFLSFLYWDGLTSIIRVTLIEKLLSQGCSAEVIREALDESARLYAPELPGYSELREAFRDQASGRGRPSGASLPFKKNKRT